MHRDLISLNIIYNPLTIKFHRFTHIENCLRLGGIKRDKDNRSTMCFFKIYIATTLKHHLKNQSCPWLSLVHNVYSFTRHTFIYGFMVINNNTSFLNYGYIIHSFCFYTGGVIAGDLY